jgi:hypothetical protein
MMYMERKPRPVTVRVSRDEYMDTRTGEVRAMTKNDTKQRDNIRAAFRALCGLIRANFEAGEGNDRQVFVTLTYAENMTDRQRLMDDWERWWRKLTKHCKGQTLDYITVAEPQGRGAWHLHAMIRSDEPLFIPHEMVSEWWGQGKAATSIERLKTDDVGRYYVAYFTALDGEHKPGNTSKSAVKGGRLHLYPVGMRLYRCSRGIVRPETVEMTYGEILDRWGLPDYRTAYRVVGPEGEVLQAIQREHYTIGEE